MPAAPSRTLWKDRTSDGFRRPDRDSKVLVSPDGKSVAFVSDRTGWLHLYVMPVNATSESQAKQLTTGGFLAGLGAWSSDSKRIAYHRSAAGNQMERFVDVVDVATGKSEAIVTDHGVNYDPGVLTGRRQPRLSSDRRRELARPLHRGGAPAVDVRSA